MRLSRVVLCVIAAASYMPSAHGCSCAGSAPRPFDHMIGGTQRSPYVPVLIRFDVDDARAVAAEYDLRDIRLQTRKAGGLFRIGPSGGFGGGLGQLGPLSDLSFARCPDALHEPQTLSIRFDTATGKSCATLQASCLAPACRPDAE